jgi:hypothetical protein
MFVIPFLQKQETGGWMEVRFLELSNEMPLVEVKLPLLIKAIVSVIWFVYFLLI